MKIIRLGLMAALMVVGFGIGIPAQAVVKYEAWASADLTVTNTRLFDFGTGTFFDVANPMSPVLEIFHSGSHIGAAGTTPGTADANHSGSLIVDGANPDITGVHQRAAADGVAVEPGVQASSLHTASSIVDLFFNPLADLSGNFFDGDVMAVDFVLDYEYFVSVYREDPSEIVDALATISLFSFSFPDTLANLLWLNPLDYPGVDLSEEFGVDLLITEQLSNVTDTAVGSGQLSFSLLLDSWFFPSDGLFLSVDVDGFGISQVPVPAPLWLIGAVLLGWRWTSWSARRATRAC